MTLDEIRKNKPDGATHYDYLDNDYLKYNGLMSWEIWSIDKWKLCLMDIDYVIDNIKPLY